MPRLRPIPGPHSRARVAKDAFMKRFAADLDCVFAFYRLPEIHANEKKLAEIKAKGREVISPLNKEGILNGLFNAHNLLAAAVGAPNRLMEVCGPAARPILTKAAKAQTHGKSIEMSRALSPLAQANGNFAAAEEFNRAASQIITDKDLTVISDDLLSRLEPRSDIATFEALGADLVGEAKFKKSSDLTTKVLVRVGSALAALVALCAPARFEIQTS